MTDLVNCRFCGLPIQLIGGYWIVNEPQTTADGISYCPPNPDHQGELGSHEPPCDHEWVSGLSIIHPEDLEGLTPMIKERGIKIYCHLCDEVYKVN